MAGHYHCTVVALTILALGALVWLVYSQIQWLPNNNLGNGDAAALKDNQVRLPQGLVEGKVLVEQVTGRRVILYQGIRFAEAKRFDRARFAAPWTDVYEATKPRVACPQLTFPLKPEQIIEPELETRFSDEDCLYMNIWQPKALDGEVRNMTRKVMFYIIGGGFDTGNIFKYAHDGQHLAGIGNVIVVSFNYRLGPFGFLNLGPGHTNLGMHDTILALDWVQLNIHHFGGDPKSVTIFGNSAGSIAVGGLVISPLRFDVEANSTRFHRAIMQSGTPDTPTSADSSSKSILKTRKLAALLDCNYQDQKAILECLRPKSTEEIMNAYREYRKSESTFQIAYGTELWPQSPAEALKMLSDQSATSVHGLIFGVVKDEGANMGRGTLTNLVEQHNLTVAGIEGAIGDLIGQWDEQLVKAYTGELRANSTETELRKAFYKAYGDRNMICPMLRFGQSMATSVDKDEVRNKHIYSYQLNQPLDAYGCNRTDGVCHAVDVHFVFGLPITYANSDRIQPPYTTEDYHLSVNIIRAWANFAKTGQPGSLDNVPWTDAFPDRAQVDKARFMALTPGRYAMQDELAEGRCRLWKKFA